MQGNERSSIRSWLVSASASARARCEVSSSSREKENQDTKEQIGDHLHHSRSNSTVSANLSNREASHSLDVPPLSELDSEVLESLPPEILSEINDFYGGKLKSFISKHKFESIDVGTSSILPGNVEGISENVAAASTSQNVDVMPSSLSQIDASVLQQLPEEIRDDILELLPAHRNLGHDRSPQGLNRLVVQAEPRDHGSCNQLWVGNPPQWVEKFKFSDSQMLRFFSETYSGLGSNCDLSSVLLRSVSTEVCISGSSSKCDDAISCLSELLKQYVELKVESDLEEIHACFRLLKRLSAKSELLLQVYNASLPHLQMIVGEKYGGSLHI